MTRQYPTNAITITTIHRPRPSIAAAFKWEIRKAGNLWYWLAIVLFNAIGIFNGWDQYQSYKPDFQAQGVTWAAVWGQAILLPSMVFIPVLVAAFADQADSRPEQCQWDPLPSPRDTGWGLPLFVVIMLMAVLALCLRRLHPLAILLTVSGLLALTGAIYGSGCTYLVIPWIVSLYACAVETKSMATLASGLGSSAMLGLLSIAFSASWHHDVHFTDLLYPTGLAFALCLTIAFLSRSVRQSRMSEQALKEERSHALTLTRERDQAMHQSRIAAELHDSVGHDLTAIIALSEGLDHASGKPEMDEAILMINDLARQGLEDTRTAVKALRSEKDPKNDPLQSVGERHSWDDITPVLDHARHVGISTALTETGRRPQDPGQANLAFTVTREAVTNALRHGQESTVLWSPGITTARAALTSPFGMMADS